MSIILLAIIAAIISQVLGWLWHGPLFGKKWGIAVAMSESVGDRPSKKWMIWALALNFIANALMSFVVFLIMANLGVGTLGQAVITMAVLFIGFALPYTLTYTLWNGRKTPSQMTTGLISIGYQAVNFLVWAVLFATLAR